MKEKLYIIYNTPEYDEWLDEEPAKSQVQVRARIANIQDEGHFGDHKELGDGVNELRWKNGRRIYYAEILERQIILLLGGNKNGQGKDIRQAKKIFNKHVSSGEES
jgi:putative addiction module killer protein